MRRAKRYATDKGVRLVYGPLACSVLIANPACVDCCIENWRECVEFSLNGRDLTRRIRYPARSH